MATRHAVMCTAAVLAAIAWTTTSSHALTMQECSAKYKAAQAAGTLKGMKWNDFRKSECGSEASAPSTPAAAPSTPAAATTPAAKPAPAAPTRPAAAPAATPPAAGSAVFPSAVSSKYSGLSAGKARMQTCLDQYNANKANNANGGLNWIQKGGGYYSECNKRLKG
jgi:hypothetical protein